MFVDKAYRESKPLFNRGRIGWALFDWANQAFTTIVITFVFAQYFAQGIVQDEVGAQSMLSLITHLEPTRLLRRSRIPSSA